jgi:ABC-type dipeptide/oligopeptide/nickel transport system ATPase subunit
MNASVAENVLFGVPLGDALRDDRIAEHPYMRRILERVGLTGDFLNIGRQVAETMVELFADLPPGHEFFEQFSFISAESLPEIQAILGRAARGLDALAENDRRRLMSLPFKLIPARHRLDLIDEALRARLLDARKAFAHDLPPELEGEIAFFDANAYNPGATIQDNILFGKLVYGQANAAQRVGALIAEIVDRRGLREVVIAVGLDSPTGSGGARLSPAQRQKVAIARCLVKRPEIILLNEAAGAFDSPTQVTIVDSVLKDTDGATVIWALNNPAMASRFNRVVVMRNGRIVEDGAHDDLAERPDGEFARMLQEL